jgi:hypothetical protein
MIAWAIDFLRRRPVIRLRMPQSTVIFTGADREAIDGVFDEGGRIVHLIIHTRIRTLGAPAAATSAGWFRRRG